MGDTAADMQKLFGKCVLFIGVEAQHWNVATFAAAAKFARSVGVDTICPKRSDGSIKWYETPAQLKAERAAVLAEGVGYVPFLYAYGPKFGDQQIRDECAILGEMADCNDGSVICDMETEWDGQVAAAELFNTIMRPVPIVLGITTWADPADQAWLGVAQALSPCCNVWIPQQYDNWLAAQPIPREETIVQPGVDLSTEFGANAVLDIVRRAAAALESAWVWEYTYAQRNEALMRQISNALHHVAAIEVTSSAPALGPEQAPTPKTGFTHAYLIGDQGYSLEEIAQHLGLSNAFEELYKPNMGELDEAAKAAGSPAGCNSGQVVTPGVVLSYRL